MCPISGHGSSVSSVLSNVEVKEVRRIWGFVVLITHQALTSPTGGSSSPPGDPCKGMKSEPLS